MPNNPYDDLLKNLIKLLEQITSLENHMHKLQDNGVKNSGIIGCAIITGNIGGDYQNNESAKRPDALPYEMIDEGDLAFLTIQLPSGADEPEVIFHTDKCHIRAGTLSGTIILKFKIIPETSTWSYNNGVLDVMMTKVTIDPQIIQDSESEDNIIES